MAYINLQPGYIVQRGDQLRRRKKSGLGWHYGTGVSFGLVEHTLPEIGKHVATLDQFADGELVLISRRERTEFEKAEVEYRALENLGGAYDYHVDNCEHDSSYAQTGVAVSPTVGAAKVIGIAAAVYLACKAIDSSRRY
jgi:hypothetical protein